MAANYLICDPATDVISWTTSPPNGSSGTYFLVCTVSTDVVSWELGSTITGAASGTYGALSIESTTDVLSWDTNV